MKATCLFTGAELGPDTREEHAIQRFMGGRLVSREITSSEFNNNCGSFCDDAMRASYGMLLTRLAPLFPSASQIGGIQADSSDASKCLFIEPGGILTMRGLAVLERDEATRRPKTVVGPDEASVRRFAKQAQMSDTAPITRVELTDDDVVSIRLPLISPEFELAALKSLLLSFDFLMRQHANRFTRSQYLAEVRSFVRTSIDEKRIHGDLLNPISLGIQLEKRPLYEALRCKMQFANTPFEHFMLVAGNFPQRCIDGVWVVFGFEPIGFRLCDSYDGDDFCYGLVNPVVKGHSASGLIELPLQDDLLCRPTNRRSFQRAGSSPACQALLMATAEQMASEIAAQRAHTCDKAIYCVHKRLESEKWLIERLRDLHNSVKSASMFELVEARLLNLYPHHQSTCGFKSAVRHAVDRQLSKYYEKLQTITDVESSMLWSYWLDKLRLALDELVGIYGLPGGGYFCDVEIRTDALATDSPPDNST
jgi:hypothetical protein